MRAVAGPGGAPRGRWIWAVSGLATAAVLTIPAAQIMARSGNAFSAFPSSGAAVLNPVATRQFTVVQAVSAIDVSSYGAPVQITAGAVSHVQVTENFSSAGKGPAMGSGTPAVTDSVSGGRLTLAAPECANGGGCEVSFALTVPRGTAATVSSAGGPVILDGLSGTLTVSSGGGFVDASGLTSSQVTVMTEGGPAVLGFGAAPRSVRVATNSGSARIGVPGGPYALTADSGGGLESVQVATSPSARDSLTVTTGGGPLLIAPSVPGVPRPVKGIFVPGSPSAWNGFPVSKGILVRPASPAKPAAPSKP